MGSGRTQQHRPYWPVKERGINWKSRTQQLIAIGALLLIAIGITFISNARGSENIEAAGTPLRQYQESVASIHRQYEAAMRAGAESTIAHRNQRDPVWDRVAAWQQEQEALKHKEELLIAEAMLHDPVVYDATEVVENHPYKAPSSDWWPVFVDAANMYGQNPYDLWRVALCESCNGCDQPDPSADNGTCKGMFQFHPLTWASTPYADRSIWDGEAQIYAAAWMWSQGRRGEWTCQ